jgi:hypothetical protein
MFVRKPLATPPPELVAQLRPGMRLVPEFHKCQGPHRWYNDTKDSKHCLLCGGTGKIVGWRVERSR